MTMTTKTCQDNHFLLWPKLRKDDYKGRHRTSTATAAPATLIATLPPAATSFFACDKRAELKLLAWMGARASAPQLTEIIQRQSVEPRAPWQIPLDGHSRAAAPTTPTWTTSRCATSTWKVSDLAADLKWEKVLYHYLEVTVEANIYVVTSPPEASARRHRYGDSYWDKFLTSKDLGEPSARREGKKNNLRNWTDWIPWDPF